MVYTLFLFFPKNLWIFLFLPWRLVTYDVDIVLNEFGTSRYIQELEIQNFLASAILHSWNTHLASFYRVLATLNRLEIETFLASSRFHSWNAHFTSFLATLNTGNQEFPHWREITS
mgnify:CR=1 FL=1